jgi:hypothetical protein
MIRLLQDPRQRKATNSGNPESQLASRTLHTKFMDQYRRAASFSSTKLTFDILRRFSSHIKAWQAGVAVLRELSSGDLPWDVGQVIALLCVCGAISETLDSHTGSTNNNQFLDDPERWGVLFDCKVKCDLYKDAVQHIWGVDLSLARGKPFLHDTRLDLLMYARGLVSSLVQDVSKIVDPSSNTHNNLGHSQRRWLQRQETPPADVSDLEPMDPELTGNVRPVNYRILGPDLHADPSSKRVSPSLLLLMTSVAVIIFLAFSNCKFRFFLPLPPLTQSFVPGFQATIEGIHALEATHSAQVDLTVTSRIDHSGSAGVLRSCRVLEDYLDMRKHGFYSDHIASRWAVGSNGDEAIHDAPFTIQDSYSSHRLGQSIVETVRASTLAMLPNHEPDLRPSVDATPPWSSQPLRTSTPGQNCNDCSISFATRINYLRHRREVHDRKKHFCQACGKGYSRRDYLTNHSCRRVRQQDQNRTRTYVSL